MGHYIMTTHDDELTDIISKRMSIPFIHGFTIKRWAKSTHIMLPKLQNKPIIGNLRCIQLIESDLNAYLKIKVNRESLGRAEKTGVLGNEIFGGDEAFLLTCLY